MSQITTYYTFLQSQDIKVFESMDIFSLKLKLKKSVFKNFIKTLINTVKHGEINDRNMQNFHKKNVLIEKNPITYHFNG